MRQVIDQMRVHDDKLRVVLNRADQVRLRGAANRAAIELPLLVLILLSLHCSDQSQPPASSDLLLPHLPLPARWATAS